MRIFDAHSNQPIFKKTEKKNRTKYIIYLEYFCYHRKMRKKGTKQMNTFSTSFHLHKNADKYDIHI